MTQKSANGSSDLLVRAMRRVFKEEVQEGRPEGHQPDDRRGATDDEAKGQASTEGKPEN